MSHDAFDDLDHRPALGVVLDEDRGALPYALVHGEALVACAAWALGEAGVTPLDVGVPWSSVQTADEAVVLHDALCPMTPAAFIAGCVEQALDHDAVVVAVRPVTDTIKRLDDDRVGETVDRDGLWAPSSPVVLPPSVVRALDDFPGQDLAAVVARLREDHRVETVEAPPEARRVTSADELALLEALTAGTPRPF
jgi:2-C-methyl-D-erythritol 4-phosphate cytidylyltransferase